MANITGGELLVRCLKAHGISKIFGLHGAHIDTIFQSCLDHKIPIIDTRHELAAGHAAEGYARVSNSPGVALVTAGGGLTNVITSIANAYLDRTPVLYLTGSGALRDDETNTLQAGIDQIGIVTPITKWAHRILNIEHIPRLTAQALRTVQTGPRGPVLLDIPWDVLTATVDEDAVPTPPALLFEHLGAPHPDMLAKAFHLLTSAKRPVIIAGSEAARSNSGEALRSLSNASGIPIFADYEGLSLLSGSALSGGLLQNLYTFTEQTGRPDVVLMLGVRFGLHTMHDSGKLIPHDARIIQIDSDGRELARLQNITLPVIADPGEMIQALNAEAGQYQWPDYGNWQRTVQKIVNDRRSAVAAQANNDLPLHPFRAVEAIANCIDRDTVVVADGALTYLWLSEVISAAQPAGFLCHGYLGSMGVGTGVAVGAQSVNPDRPVILVTGDGAVGYSLGEFDTLVRHNLPLIIIILNNRGWGATLHFQKLAIGPDRITNTRLENGAYEEVAKALGVDGYYVEKLAEIETSINKALNNKRPACINIRVALDPIPPEEFAIMGQDPF